MAKFLFLFLLIGAPYASAAEFSVHGILKERGTRKPLAHVKVYCLDDQKTPPLVLKSETDSEGRFFFPKLDLGAYKWVVQLSGYEKLEKPVEFTPETSAQPIELFIQKSSYQVYETTVYGEGEKRDEKTQSLSQDQFIDLVGGNGDPVKAVQNLPGVNRAPPLSAQVIIEGSAPDDTGYTVDTQVVPNIFHFGGLTSVVMPEAIDRVDYLSAGFGPEFGQSIAGYVNLYTRDPKTDRLHGFAFADVFNVGGMVEGPAGKNSSFLIGARQSYIGAVLSLATKGDSDFNLTTAPDFADTVLEYETQVTPIDSFKLLTIGSEDSLAFILSTPVNQDPSIRGSFDSYLDFYRVIPEWIHKNGSKTTTRYWLGLGRDWQRIDSTGYFFHYSNYTISSRAEVEHEFSPSWKSYFGTDNNFMWSRMYFTIPVFYTLGGVQNPFSASQTVQTSSSYSTDAFSLYWRNIVHESDSKWTYLPGLRIDGYSLTQEYAVPEPRIAVRYDAGDGLVYRAASGLYVQSPQDQQLDPNYGNTSLNSEYAIHGTVGAEKDFRHGAAQGWTLSGDLFYKQLYDLVVSSDDLVVRNGVLVPEYYNNGGRGRAFGGELLAKFQQEHLSGWLAYTLSRSTRWSSDFPQEVLFDYDQTHALTAIAAYETSNNWKFSARLRYTSGDPYTPVIGGVFDSDDDVYLPTRGGLYSQRLSPFFEFDVRFDKKWIYDKWILSLYLDIENLTNASNPQAIINSYNYTQTATISGLPILPTFGVRGEF